MVTDCRFCSLTVGNANGSLNATIIDLIGSGKETGTLVDAGSYEVSVWNMSDFPGTIISISVVETVASVNISSEPLELVRPTTVFSSTNSTRYTQSNVPIYTVLGLVPSEAVILSIAIVAATAILMDRRLSTVSKSRHRKRRK
jgi:hypothetical protein